MTLAEQVLDDYAKSRGKVNWDDFVKQFTVGKHLTRPVIASNLVWLGNIASAISFALCLSQAEVLKEIAELFEDADKASKESTKGFIHKQEKRVKEAMEFGYYGGYTSFAKSLKKRLLAKSEEKD